MTEAQLIERSRKGDPDAYEALVRAYSDLAFRAAFVITGDASDAEDAAQEAFTKAWFALDRFEPAKPFRPWLLRIVSNEAYNRRKSATRRVQLASRVESVHAGVNGEGSPEQAAIASEEQARVMSVFHTLRDDDRLVLAYRYFFDLTEAEMADALGIARGTVKSRLSRALGRLRERLQEQEALNNAPQYRGKEAD